MLHTARRTIEQTGSSKFFFFPARFKRIEWDDLGKMKNSLARKHISAAAAALLFHGPRVNGPNDSPLSQIFLDGLSRKIEIQ
jgi:hypothetical protein